MAKRKRKRRKKKVRFGRAIFQALAISMSSAAIIVGLAILSFVMSPHIKINGQPLMPLIPPVVIIMVGWLAVKYVIPLFVRLRCPKCGKQELRYDCNLNLSFHCKACGIDKSTWFYIR